MRLPASSRRSRRASLAVVAGAAALAAVALGSSLPGYARAPSRPMATAPLIATPHGVGPLRLGMRATALRARGLIGPLRRGCELVPGQREASLRAPLRGRAIFLHPSRRLWSIIVTAGAVTARGIGVGDTAARVLRAYPHAQYMRPNPNAPIPDGMIGVNHLSHPRMTFVIDPSNRRVSELDVPFASFCE